MSAPASNDQSEAPTLAQCRRSVVGAWLRPLAYGCVGAGTTGLWCGGGEDWRHTGRRSTSDQVRGEEAALNNHTNTPPHLAAQGACITGAFIAGACEENHNVDSTQNQFIPLQ